jgi:hypothetical protein
MKSLEYEPRKACSPKPAARELGKYNLDFMEVQRFRYKVTKCKILHPQTILHYKLFKFYTIFGTGEKITRGEGSLKSWSGH